MAGQLDQMGDNITRWSRRASRPVQIGPLGQTIAASVVQAQKQANHASALLEQTKQFIDNIRS